MGADFTELQTIKAWGLTPAQWREQPVDDRARMMSYEMVSATRKLFSDEKDMAELEAKSKGSSSHKKVENAYQRQKREWGIKE